MKMLLFWVVIIGFSIVAFWIYDKTSMMTTVFDSKISSPWFDLALVVLLGYTVVLRSISFYIKMLR